MIIKGNRRNAVSLFLLIMITSLQNEQIKSIVKLRERKHREATGKVLVDGRRNIELALKAGWRFESVYYYSDKPEADSAWIQSIEKTKCTVIPVSQSVFKKISYGDVDSGVIGISSAPKKTLQDLPSASDPLFIVLEGVEKPGNVGAVLRTADALQVTGVILCESGTDLYNPNIIRASLGTCFSLPYVSVDYKELNDYFRKNKIRCYTLFPLGSRKYTEEDYRGGVALVAGSEHSGLTEKWRDMNLKAVNIPMKGIADSLNVSVAMTVVLYEAARQRNMI